MTYISGLPGSSKLDGHASTKEKARRTAWRAHAASTLGDIVARVNLLHSRTQLNLHSGVFSLLVRKLLETYPADACKDDVHSATILCARPYQGIVSTRLETVDPWPTETEKPSGQPKLGASLSGKPPPATDAKEIARNVFALEQVGFNHLSPSALNT